MFFCLWLTLEILEKSTKAYLVCLWYVLVLDAREVNDEINDRSLVGVLFVYVYLCKRKNKTFINCNLFCRNNTWGICTFIIIVESTVKTAKNTTTNCLNCNIQTSEDEKVKIVCYSPKKRTNLLQAKYKEWNACPRQAFHVMLNHSTKFQRMPKLHLQKQASRLTKNSYLSCTKLKNVSA